MLPSSFGAKLLAAGRLRGQAMKAERRGRGRECLALLDQADRNHPQTARTYVYLRAWCLMRVGRCAAGKRLLVQYYQRLGTVPASSKPAVQWAANAKCPATSGKPEQQLARVYQQITTSCAMGSLARCTKLARLLQGLRSKVPRPHTAKQKSMFNQGFMRAGIRMAKARRCRDAWRLLLRATAVYYGSSQQARSRARRLLRVYGKGCPDPTGGP